MPIFKPFIVIAALALAVMSGAASMASAFARLNPALAASSPIANGPALARLAQYRMAEGVANEPREESQDFPRHIPSAAIALARRALAKEPLSDSAAAVLILAENASGDREATLPIVKSAYRLNRRNEVVTLWLARDAAIHGEVAPTLAHFDEVLRTSKDARTMVLARFALATADRSFRREMAGLMRKRPPWADEFWSVAPQVQGAAKPIGELRLLLADSDLEFLPQDDRKLVEQLLAAGEFGLAESLYRAEANGRTDGAGEFVRNPRFDRPSRVPLVDWLTYSGGDFGSEIVADEGLLLFSAITPPGGAVAREWVSLHPGKYLLTARLKTIGRSEDDRVLARFTCLNGSASSRFVDIELEEGDTKRTFAVGNDCRNYWLDVVAAPAERSTGFDGELDLLSIRRGE